jgi:hypothetical protein
MAKLHHLQKSKGRYDIIFEEDLKMDPDGWFVTVKKINKKDGSIADESCIILKDVPQWVDSFIRSGYVLTPIKAQS